MPRAFRAILAAPQEVPLMARQDSESLWIAIGALGAMALGVGLIPLRTLRLAVLPEPALSRPAS